MSYGAKCSRSLDQKASDGDEKTREPWEKGDAQLLISTDEISFFLM